MSRPESVAVTWISSGLPVGLSISAIAQAARMRRRALTPGWGTRQWRRMCVSTRRSKSDLQNVMGPASRMQHRAPPASAMGIDEIVDRRDYIRLRQCLHHQRAFPQVVFGQRPVLQRAAAAGAEMLADRLGALVAGLSTCTRCRRSGWPGYRLDRHGLAGQSIWHIDGPSGVSATPSPRWPRRRNAELLSHAPPRAGIQHCRRRLRSGRG